MDCSPIPKLVCIFLFVTFAGCSSESQTAATKPNAMAAADSGPAQWLIGTWYGRAELDQDKLRAKITATTDSAQRSMLQTISTTFQTTEIGARFDAQGNMELDVQIDTPDGGVVRDGTTGWFEILSRTANSVTIETVEHLPNGGTQTGQVTYHFDDNGQVATMIAPTSPELADCHPRFVFRRVELPSAEVARQPGDQPTK